MADAGKAFDLNNPPVSISNPGGLPANVFQEYPKHLKRANGTYLSVSSAEAEAAARADGWFLTVAEAKAADAVPVVVEKRGPGRPKADAA